MPNILCYETKLKLAHERIKRKGETRTRKANQNKTDDCFKEEDNVSDADDKKIAKFFAVYERPYKIDRRLGAATHLLIDPTYQGKEEGSMQII